jgi:hypothetical protein
MEKTYEQVILEGIRGLPPETLAEIADFVYFVRKRILQPGPFEEERQVLALRTDLRALSIAEQRHLESEFEGYEQLYPRE